MYKAVVYIANTAYECITHTCMNNSPYGSNISLPYSCKVLCTRVHVSLKQSTNCVTIFISVLEALQLGTKIATWTVYCS